MKGSPHACSDVGTVTRINRVSGIIEVESNSSLYDLEFVGKELLQNLRVGDRVAFAIVKVERG